MGSGGVCAVECLRWVLSFQDQAGSAVEAVPDGLDLSVGDVGQSPCAAPTLAAIPVREVPFGQCATCTAFALLTRFHLTLVPALTTAVPAGRITAAILVPILALFYR